MARAFRSRRNPKQTALVAMVGLLAGVLGLAGVAIAQDGPASSCQASNTVEFGSAFFGTEDNGNRLLSTSPTSREYPLAAPLAAGTYAVDAVSYDGYSTRDVIPPQPLEQWFAELLGSDGTVLATTGQTADIEDSVIEASWTGSLGDITIAAEATSVRVVHSAPNSANVNSVRPVCLGFAGSADNGGDDNDNGGDDNDNGGDDNDGEIIASIAVDYENTAGASSPVEVECGEDNVDAATGSDVQLLLEGLDPAAEPCTIMYTNGANNCDVVISSNAEGSRFDGNDLIIDLPAAGGDVSVQISCDGIAPTDGDDDDDSDNDDNDDDDGEQTVTTTPATTTTTTTTIKPEVGGATETAEAVDADPSFTG